MRSAPVRGKQFRSRAMTISDALTVVIPTMIGVIWAVIAVDLTFLLEIDWLAAPHGVVAVIAYVIQVIVFWPSALFFLAVRALPVIGWQPGWFGLSLLTVACGGVPGAFVGLAVFSWSRRWLHLWGRGRVRPPPSPGAVRGARGR